MSKSASWSTNFRSFNADRRAKWCETALARRLSFRNPRNRRLTAGLARITCCIAASSLHATMATPVDAHKTVPGSDDRAPWLGDPTEGAGRVGEPQSSRPAHSACRVWVGRRGQAPRQAFQGAQRSKTKTPPKRGQSNRSKQRPPGGRGHEDRRSYNPLNDLTFPGLNNRALPVGGGLAGLLHRQQGSGPLLGVGAQSLEPLAFQPAEWRNVPGGTAIFSSARSGHPLAITEPTRTNSTGLGRGSRRADWCPFQIRQFEPIQYAGSGTGDAAPALS